LKLDENQNVFKGFRRFTYLRPRDWLQSRKYLENCRN